MCMSLCKCNTNSSHDDVNDENEDVYNHLQKQQVLGNYIGAEH